ncbi:hypothetical protein SAMIE_1026650 [Sphingobium amiense]|uniref:Cobalamin ABC transporter n=1 Tax=Sphingobium amiense TaxID=135719 RepID=A0A494W3N3_9SPHN|nr:hypothetical protein [Sphingobium amiense]BBD99164.1 hypothetical protein SAMIE_1026650 [Sphingobium amiense]
MVRPSRHDLALFGALVLVMLATRTHYVSNLVHLPDTSLASFFVLGFFVRRPWAFAGLFLLAVVIDFIMIGWLGRSSFCVTPAYWMLAPAYGTMWLAGRFGAERLGPVASALPLLLLLLVAAAFLSQLFSSGGFYFLGDRFADPSLAGFLPRLARHFPLTLYSTLLWSAVAAGVYGLLSTARSLFAARASR